MSREYVESGNDRALTPVGLTGRVPQPEEEFATPQDYASIVDDTPD